MVGRGLAVAVVVLNVGLQGVLVVLLGLLPLPLLLCHDARLVVGSGLAVGVVVLNEELQGLLVVLLGLLPLCLMARITFYNSNIRP